MSLNPWWHVSVGGMRGIKQGGDIVASKCFFGSVTAHGSIKGKLIGEISLLWLAHMTYKYWEVNSLSQSWLFWLVGTSIPYIEWRKVLSFPPVQTKQNNTYLLSSEFWTLSTHHCWLGHLKTSLCPGSKLGTLYSVGSCGVGDWNDSAVQN